MSEEKPNQDGQAEKLAAAEAAKAEVAAAGPDANARAEATANQEFNEQELMNLIQSGRDFARVAAAAETPAFASMVNKEISRSGWSRAPLHFAAEVNRPDIVRLLIAKGAAVDQVVAGHTPLTLAAGRNNIECVKILLEHKASINQQPGTAPALWHASLGGSDELVGLLLENKADVNQSGPRGTALQAACLRADVEVIRRLLAAGAKSDPAVPTAAMLLPWKNVSLLRKLMERGIRASVDLAGKPLERLQTVTLLAKERTSYLHYMGADALDTFLPYLIASYTPNVGDEETSGGATTTRAGGGDRRAAGGGDKRNRSQDERPQTNAADAARTTATTAAAAPAQTPATPAAPVSIIPNEQVVQACLAMGFSRAQAVDAVLATGNNDTNAAVQHLLAEQAATAQPKAPVAPPPAPKEDAGTLLESLGFAKAEIAAAIAAVGQDAEAATQWILDKQAKSAVRAAVPTSPAPEFKFSIQTDPTAVVSSPLNASFAFAPSPLASAPIAAPFPGPASSPAKAVELSNLIPTEAELTSEASLSRSPSKSPGGARGNAHRRPSKH